MLRRLMRRLTGRGPRGPAVGDDVSRAASAGVAGAPAGAEATTSGGQPVRPAPRRDWEGLPPVARFTDRPMATAADVAGFSSEVASTVAPQLYLAPLGHDLDDAAPRGRVSGVIAPVIATEPFAETPPHRDELPLLRPSDGAHRRGGRRAGATSEGAATPATATGATAGTSRSSDVHVPPILRTARSVPEPTPSLPKAARPDELPLRPLGAPGGGGRSSPQRDVGDAGPTTGHGQGPSSGATPEASGPPRPLLGSSAEGGPAARRPAPDGSSATPADTGSAGPASSSPRPSRPLAGDLRRKADAPSAGSGGPVQRTAADGPLTPGRGDGVGHRPGVGAPIGELPASAQPVLGADRRRGGPAVSGVGRDAAVAAAMEHLVVRRGGDLAPDGELQGSSEPRRGGPPSDGPGTAVGPSSRAREPGPPARPAGPAVHTRRLDAPLHRQVDPDRPRAPLLGDRPAIGASPGPVRPLSTGAETTADTDAPPPPVVPVRWPHTDGSASGSAQGSARGPRAPSGGPPPPGLPGAASVEGTDTRSASATQTSPPPVSGAPTRTGAATSPSLPVSRSAVAHDPGSSASTDVSAASPAGLGLGHGGTPDRADRGPAAPRSLDVAGARAAAAVAPSRLPVVQTARPSDATAPLPTVPAAAAPGATAATHAAPPSVASPPVQRAVDVGEMVTGAAPVGGVEDVADDDASSLTTQVMRRLTEDRQEMAILVDRLYPQLRDELRWELRAQRERAGLLADPL